MDKAALSLVHLSIAMLPLGFYFLVLGLINCWSHPYLLSLRTDFVIVVCVTLPLIVAPGHSLPEALSGLDQLALAALLLSAVYLLLPAPWRGWVIYNRDKAQSMRLLLAVLGELGVRAEASGEFVELHGRILKFRLVTLEWMRNVCIHVLQANRSETALLKAVAGRLRERLDATAAGPHRAGLALLLAGVLILAVSTALLAANRELLVQMVRELLAGRI